jgi:IS5 family transposase
VIPPVPGRTSRRRRSDVMDQLSFASLNYAVKKKRTNRDGFLAEMAAAVPWAKLEAVTEAHYLNTGQKAAGARSRFLSCCASTPAAVVQPARSGPRKRSSTSTPCARSADWSSVATPSPTRQRSSTSVTAGMADLTKAVFPAVAEHLEARGALLRGGTIVDARLIAASPSTKNRAGKRDPEMRSSKKGNQYEGARRRECQGDGAELGDVRCAPRSALIGECLAMVWSTGRTS